MRFLARAKLFLKSVCVCVCVRVCVCLCVLEGAVLKLQRREEMAGDTIFAFAIFSQQFCNYSKSHLTHMALWEWQEVGISKIN